MLLFDIKMKRIDAQAQGTQQRQKLASIKRIGEAMKALALCHNVVPIHESPSAQDGKLSRTFEI